MVSDTEQAVMLTPAEVETIYAAFEKVACLEAKTLDGKRSIVTPLYEAVIAARVATAQSSGVSHRHPAALETIRRYHAGDITEKQACDWFGVDRLTFRSALYAEGARDE